MAINYMKLISEFYSDIVATTTSTNDDYESIQWSGEPVPKEDLDILYLINLKTTKILELSQFAYEEIVAGFNSNALGYPHYYDSALEDQINLIGAVATGSDMPYACKGLTKGIQVVDVGGLVTEATPTGLINDVSTFNAEIRGSGISVYVSIVGQAAQTYGELITEIQSDFNLSQNTDLSISLQNGNILITNNIYGGESTVDIRDTNLFNNLQQFVQVMPAINGLAGKDVAQKVYKQHTSAQLLQVINDGKDVKLAALQKFNVKRAQVMEAASIEDVNAITWE